MKYSLLVVLFATIIPSSLLADEPSAFGAGDLSNPQPYGLTASEEVLLQNKQKLHKIAVKSNNQANEVDSLRERIDGLQSIIESLSEKAQENKKNIKNIEQLNATKLKNSDEYEKRLSEVSQLNSSVSQKNLEDIEKIKLVIAELSSLIDTINTTYITKDEFNTLVNDVNDFKELVAKELSAKKTHKKSDFDGMSSAEIAKKARELYKKKYYTKSIEYYTHLINKNYKPANAHYMIGEMKYYRKNYAEAIAYFKKSASLYSKASYMPVLMLHTAVAMEKTGDKKNAKAFYKGIISKYPDSKYAKEAKKFLDLIK